MRRQKNQLEDSQERWMWPEPCREEDEYKSNASTVAVSFKPVLLPGRRKYWSALEG